jgi:hypothetical protein
MKGGIDLVQAASFKEILHVTGTVSSTDDVAGVGKVTVATFAREAKKKEKPPPPLGIAWIVADGALSVAVAAEPAVVMRLGAKPDKKLGDDPTATKFAGDLGGTASTFVALQPLRLDPKRAHLPAAPILIAVGKKENNPAVRALVPDPLLREVARAQMGF